jgi:predicted lipoprotein with Yx(FWY)xxD motif
MRRCPALLARHASLTTINLEEKPIRRFASHLQLAAAAAAVLIAATACSTPTHDTDSSGAQHPPAATTEEAGTTVAARQDPLGTILIDGSGRTVYLFEKDTSPTSTCTGDCASAWPPVTTTGAAHAGPGATASLVATTPRADGPTQLTYAGHPLYYYAGDHTAGDTHGQGLDQFGAGWYVLTPAGTKIDND